MKHIIVSESLQAALELVTAAQADCAESITAMLFDVDQASAVACSGVSEVVLFQVSPDALKEEVSILIANEAKKNGGGTILFANSKRMVNTAGQVAQMLDTVPATDVKAFIGGTAKHMMYGGKITVSEKSTKPFSIAVMQSASCDPATTEKKPCPIRQIEVSAGRARVIGKKDKDLSSVDLHAAKTIVCIGRGVDSREGFEKCVGLKDALNGEMGCSRPVTETEDPLMPRETYIGASGVIVKPDLFIAIAVSGQAQHTMGMFESKVVVAIDKNANAPFLQQCDYGIVGDYATIVPAITDLLG